MRTRFAVLLLLILIPVREVGAVSDGDTPRACYHGIINNLKQLLLSKKLSGLSRVDSWQELPDPTREPLQKEFVNRLLENPKTARLRSALGDGTGLIFQIDDNAGNGERVQSRFLEKVLQAVFPKAKFGASSDGESRKIYFQVRDSFEGGTHSELPSYRVEMSTLKKTNPGPEMEQERGLRKAMRLPPNAKIASAYASVRATDYEFFSVVERLFKSGNVQGVILSHSPSTLEKQATQRSMSSLRRHFGEILVLTQDELKQAPLDRFDGNFLILNNSVQRMPYVHGASDFTVVVGAANIFESLNAGRPTYFYQSVDHAYSPQAWEDMSSTAIATGAGHAFESGRTKQSGSSPSAKSLDELLTSTLSQAIQSKPYEVRDRSGKTPLDHLLSNLERVLGLETSDGSGR